MHAVEYCIESGILAEFFATRKKEVVKNMTIDMTFERRLELSAIENRDEGREEGREIVIIDKVIKKVAKNKSLIQIADELEEDINAIKVMYDTVVDNPDYSAQEIYDVMHDIS